MAEARRAHDWSIASSVLALLANCHRDAKKTRPFKPADFDPTVRTQQVTTDPIPADIGVLRDVFIKPRKENKA